MAERDPLLQRLLAAESAPQLEELVAANLQEVLAAFPGWTTVPAPIRHDPGATERYVHRVVLVARLLAAQGHPGPLRTIEGDRDHNPMYRWSETFAQAQALAGAGRHADSVQVLTALLADLDQASGSAVDDVRSKVYGALGAVWFDAGDVGQSLHWTDRALEACRANGDTEGIATYRENLQVLEALHLPSVDPKAGAQLLECRRLIVAAQTASDRFDYADSNQALGDALTVLSEGDERLRSSFAGKIYGLRGWNHHHLGDRAAARADTERALSECRAAGDPNGVRVYTANLRFLSR
jgi:tetratricopeptide (TPR) repeat protein